MKAAVVKGDGKVVVESVPEPFVGPYQCLCEITACASCTGTDRKIIDGHFGGGENFPGILGHESVGRVVQVGEKVRNNKVGDIFLRPSCVYPGERLGGYGSLWGCLAEYGLVTDGAAYIEDNPGKKPNGFVTYQQKVPQGLKVSDEELTLLVTLKELASFLAEIKIPFYSSLVVLGTGSVAMAVSYFAKLMGAYPVVAVGRRDDALARMADVGADILVNSVRENAEVAAKAATGGKGAEIVVDTTGSVEMIESASLLLAESGRIVVYALPEQETLVLNCGKGPGRKSLCVDGPREEKAHQYLLDLLRLEAVPLKTFYSHTLPFAEVAEGYRMLAERKATKIVFKIR